MIAVLLLLGGFALLSAAHELGHAVAARLLGLEVTEICLGLGPPFLRFRRAGVIWVMAPLPIGGYVRVSELAPGVLSEPGRFRPGAVARRIATIAAGPAANYLLAALAGFAIAVTGGLDTGRALGLTIVAADEGARRAGLAVGDLLTEVEGHKVESLGSLRRGLAAAGQDGNVTVTVTRGGHPVRLRMARLRGPGGWGLGAAYVVEPERAPAGLWSAVAFSLSRPIVDGRAMLGDAADLLARAEGNAARPSAVPVGLVGLADRVRASGAWTLRRILLLAIALSTAMGLVNLLPFPGLDGGRVVIEAVEAVRRRRLQPRAVIAVQIVGALIVAVCWLGLTVRELLAR